MVVRHSAQRVISAAGCSRGLSIQQLPACSRVVALPRTDPQNIRIYNNLSASLNNNRERITFSLTEYAVAAGNRDRFSYIIVKVDVGKRS